MKHRIFMSALAVLVVFAATTTAQAGIFGRLSTVWHGCNPCEPVACQPCEQAACEPVACKPCEVASACDPCAACCDPCGNRPFRPFGGFFANISARLAATHCDAGCNACEPVACQPCEVAACQPCEAACDPCGDAACGPCLPFNGFFLNLKARLSAVHCGAASCDPCEPVQCDPCTRCR